MATSEEKVLPTIGSRATETQGLTRREMLWRLLAGAGSGTAWPLVAASHPMFEHLRNEAILAEAEKLEEAADWKPVFLNVQQNEDLVALAESIMPGSTKAKVSRFIDLLLSVDKPENQQEFVRSLSAFQAETQKRFGKRFPALADEQKNALLTEASETDATNKVAKGTDELHPHFENLKGWVSGAYYSSEAGMRELGWTGDYAFVEFPGCTHKDEHN